MKHILLGWLALTCGLWALSGQSMGQQATEYPNPYANIPVSDLTPEQKSYILEVEWAKSRGLPPPPLPGDGKDRPGTAPKFDDDTAKKGNFAPMKAMVQILSFQKNKSTRQGTGFVADKANKLVISTQHLVGPGENVDLIFPEIRGDKVVTERDYYVKNPRFVKGKVIYRVPNRDLVIIEAESLPANVTELKPSNDRPKVGQQVQLIGNPVEGNSLWTYDPGRIKNVGSRTITDNKGNSFSGFIVEVATDTPLNRLDRGGPLVNDKGDLVAIETPITQSSPLITMANDASAVRRVLSDAYRDYAALLMSKKLYETAVAYCTRSIESNPMVAASYVDRGAAYSYLDKYDLAIADYSSAIKLDSRNARAYRSRGSAYFYQSKYDKAIADCTKAIEINPNYALAYLTRSKAYSKNGQPEKAKQDHDKAIQLDPKLK